MDSGEKEKQKNHGYSFNSKKVAGTLGYLNTKQICYCLAHALMKHIEFSNGFFFLKDKQDAENNNFAFTYNAGALKVNLPK